MAAARARRSLTGLFAQTAQCVSTLIDPLLGSRTAIGQGHCFVDVIDQAFGFEWL